MFINYSRPPVNGQVKLADVTFFRVAPKGAVKPDPPKMEEIVTRGRELYIAQDTASHEKILNGFTDLVFSGAFAGLSPEKCHDLILTQILLPNVNTGIKHTRDMLFEEFPQYDKRVIQDILFEKIGHPFLVEWQIDVADKIAKHLPDSGKDAPDGGGGSSGGAASSSKDNLVDINFKLGAELELEPSNLSRESGDLLQRVNTDQPTITSPATGGGSGGAAENPPVTEREAYVPGDQPTPPSVSPVEGDEGKIVDPSDVPTDIF